MARASRPLYRLIDIAPSRTRHPQESTTPKLTDMARWIVIALYLPALLAAPISTEIFAPARWSVMPGIALASMLTITACWLIETGRAD